MFRSLIIVSFTLSLLGCQAQRESTSTVSERALWSVPPSSVELSNWQAPDTLLDLSFIGDLVNAEQQRRILYYENPNGAALEVKLAPLPGGWDSIPASRAISGHFLYQQQNYANRAKRHEIALSWLKEKTSLPADLPAEIWQIDYQTEEASGIWHHSLWVTLLHPTFVTFHLRFPEGTHYSALMLEEALHNFAQQNYTFWHTQQ